MKYEAKKMMSIIYLETLNIEWGQIDPKGNRRVTTFILRPSWVGGSCNPSHPHTPLIMRPRRSGCRNMSSWKPRAGRSASRILKKRRFNARLLRSLWDSNSDCFSSHQMGRVKGKQFKSDSGKRFPASLFRDFGR